MASTSVILHIIDRLGFGEINQPVQFAKQLPADTYVNFFILPPEQLKYLPEGYPYFLLTGERQCNMDFFQQFLATNPVCAVLISTYYEFSLEHLFLLDWVDSIQLPVATFLADYINIEHDQVIYNGIDRKQQQLRAIPPHMSLISFIPKTNSEGTRLHLFSPYPEIHPLPRERIRQVRCELAIPEDHQVIFFPLAKWTYYQSLLDKNKYLYYVVGELITRLLIATQKKLTVIHIADFTMLKPTTPALQFKTFKSLPQADYNQYALASDLILTLNPTSPVLALAIIAGIPQVTLVNQYSSLQPQLASLLTPAQMQTPIFPFTIFPLGRTQEATDLINSTPMRGAPLLTELQDIPRSRRLIKQFLEKKGKKYQHLMQAFGQTRTVMNNMQTAADVIQKITLRAIPSGVRKPIDR